MAVAQVLGPGRGSARLALRVMRSNAVVAYAGTFVAMSLTVVLAGPIDGRTGTRWIAVWTVHAAVAAGAAWVGLATPVRPPELRLTAGAVCLALLIVPGTFAVADPDWTPVATTAAAGLVAVAVVRPPHWDPVAAAERSEQAATDVVRLRDVDWSVWVPAPGPPRVPDRHADEEWATVCADWLCRRAGVRPGPVAGGLARDLWLPAGGRGWPDGEDWVAKLVHQRSPASPAVPAVVEVRSADAEPASGAGDTTLVLTSLGTGVRSVSPADLPIGAGTVGAGTVGPGKRISYAWRVERLGASGDRAAPTAVEVRLWAVGEPADVERVAPDLDRLARCLHPGPAALPA